MKDILHKMRSKSDATKNKLAMVFAAGFTFVIVGIWVLTLQNGKTPVIVQEKSASEDLRPLRLIFQNAKDGFNDIKSNAKNYKASSADADEDPGVPIPPTE